MSQENDTLFRRIVKENDLERDVLLTIAAEDRRLPRILRFCLDYDRTCQDGLGENQTGYEACIEEVARRYGLTDSATAQLLNNFENQLEA